MNIYSDTALQSIAFAAYRNINLDTARHFESLGIGPAEFFGKSAMALAAATGIKADYFDDRRRHEALEAARTELAFIRGNKVRAVYHSDPEYPARLAECADAPAMLYVAGKPDAAAEPHSVAIVGTRHCTAYGADFTRRLVADLAASLDGGLLVVSGLAFGIDIAAHRAALDNGVPTAAVLAHGLNTIYPADHRSDAQNIIRRGGFLATEYRSSDRIHRGNFLARNRLIAALADVTVVVESDIRGGAMATARLAAAYNREVMALPGRVNDTYSRGCLQLLATDTASVLRDAGDLIGLMGWRVKQPSGTQAEMHFEVSQEYAAVLNLLKERPDITANEMCVALGVPFGRLSSLLFQMEMDDYILSLPGGRYTLPSSSL